MWFNQLAKRKDTLIMHLKFLRDDEKASVSTKILAEVAKWMERFDCIIVGPGLGRDPFLLVCFHY